MVTGSISLRCVARAGVRSAGEVTFRETPGDAGARQGAQVGKAEVGGAAVQSPRLESRGIAIATWGDGALDTVLEEVRTFRRYARAARV